MRKRLTILFIAAGPTDMLPLGSAAEYRRIDDEIRSCKVNDRVELLPPALAATRGHLERTLMLCQPDLVHFSGHGLQSGELVIEKDDTRQSEKITPAVLAGIFGVLTKKVRCVFLNACWSQLQAEALVAQVSCVVGMERQISDTSALSFASGFYRALFCGQSIASALKLGIGNISTKNLSEQQIPKLTSQSLGECDQPLLVRDSTVAELIESLGLLKGKLPTVDSMRRFLIQLFSHAATLDFLDTRDSAAAIGSKQSAPVSLEARIDGLLARRQTDTLLLALLHQTELDEALRDRLHIHLKVLEFVTYAEYAEQRKAEEKRRLRAQQIHAVFVRSRMVVGSVCTLLVLCSLLTLWVGRSRTIDKPDDKHEHAYKENYRQKLEYWRPKNNFFNTILIRSARVTGSAEQRKIWLRLEIEWIKDESTLPEWTKRSYSGVLVYEGTYSQLKDGMPQGLSLELADYSFKAISPALANAFGFIDFPVAVHQQDINIRCFMLDCLNSNQKVCSFDLPGHCDIKNAPPS